MLLSVFAAYVKKYVLYSTVTIKSEFKVLRLKTSTQCIDQQTLIGLTMGDYDFGGMVEVCQNLMHQTNYRTAMSVTVINQSTGHLYI